MATNESSKYVPTETDLAQAKALFEEIATSSNQIEAMFVGLDEDSTPAETTAIVNAACTLLNRLGWLGDLGVKKLSGHYTIMGDSEHWLVNQTYTHEIFERAKTA
jgi:hypothetical protein